MIRYLVIASLLLAACGRDEGNSGYGASDGSITLSLDSKKDLPSCKTQNENQLVYVKKEKMFFECNDGKWSEVKILGEDGEDGADGSSGMAIDEVWAYGVDSYASSADIGEGGLLAYIGNVNIVKFSDGSGHLSITGSIADSDSNSDVYEFDFAHSFFVAKELASEAQLYASKVHSYVDTVALYDFSLSLDTPYFAAWIDTDGNTSNSAPISFTLTKIE